MPRKLEALTVPNLIRLCSFDGLRPAVVDEISAREDSLTDGDLTRLYEKGLSWRLPRNVVAIRSARAVLAAEFGQFKDRMEALERLIAMGAFEEQDLRHAASLLCGDDSRRVVSVIDGFDLRVAQALCRVAEDPEHPLRERVEQEFRLLARATGQREYRLRQLILPSRDLRRGRDDIPTVPLAVAGDYLRGLVNDSADMRHVYDALERLGLDPRNRPFLLEVVRDRKGQLAVRDWALAILAEAELTAELIDLAIGLIQNHSRSVRGEVRLDPSTTDTPLFDSIHVLGRAAEKPDADARIVAALTNLAGDNKVYRLLREEALQALPTAALDEGTKAANSKLWGIVKSLINGSEDLDLRRTIAKALSSAVWTRPHVVDFFIELDGVNDEGAYECIPDHAWTPGLLGVVLSEVDDETPDGLTSRLVKLVAGRMADPGWQEFLLNLSTSTDFHVEVRATALVEVCTLAEAETSDGWATDQVRQWMMEMSGMFDCSAVINAVPKKLLKTPEGRAFLVERLLNLEDGVYSGALNALRDIEVRPEELLELAAQARTSATGK